MIVQTRFGRSIGTFLFGTRISVIVNNLLIDSEMESLLYFGDFDALDKAYNARKADLDNEQVQELKTLSATSATLVPIKTTIKTIDVSAPPTTTKIGQTPCTGSRMAGMKRERNIIGFPKCRLGFRKCKKGGGKLQGHRRIGLRPEVYKRWRRNNICRN